VRKGGAGEGKAHTIALHSARTLAAKKSGLDLTLSNRIASSVETCRRWRRSDGQQTPPGRALHPSQRALHPQAPVLPPVRHTTRNSTAGIQGSVGSRRTTNILGPSNPGHTLRLQRYCKPGSCAHTSCWLRVRKHLALDDTASALQPTRDRDHTPQYHLSRSHSPMGSFLLSSGPGAMAAICVTLGASGDCLKKKHMPGVAAGNVPFQR